MVLPQSGESALRDPKNSDFPWCTGGKSDKRKSEWLRRTSVVSNVQTSCDVNCLTSWRNCVTSFASIWCVEFRPWVSAITTDPHIGHLGMASPLRPHGRSSGILNIDLSFTHTSQSCDNFTDGRHAEVALTLLYNGWISCIWWIGVIHVRVLRGSNDQQWNLPLAWK
jgi:hypothetical protein